MHSINLDAQQDAVRQFVLSLPLDPEGASLELHGQTVALVYPPKDSPVDREELRAAILSRRDESRQLNGDWLAADSEIWTSENDSNAVK